MEWKVCAASVCGAAHLAADTPCQDAFHWVRTPSLLLAAVCDGAGSARCGGPGAQRVSREFATRLAQEPALATFHGDEIAAQVFALLADIRLGLQREAEEKQGALGDFACTLVAACLFDDHGWLIHLGDGAAAAVVKDRADVVSLPENGEYVNHTWFLTSPDWREHVRITPLHGPVTQIVLMSDGVQPFAMNKGGTQLFGPFIDPVLRFLDGVDETQGSQALSHMLCDPRIDAITGDDKTLLIGIREEHGQDDAPLLV